MMNLKPIWLLSFILTIAIAQQDTLDYGDVQSVVPNPYTESTNPEWPDQKGYVAGTNVYRDIGKYQRFDFYSSNYIIGAVLYFGLVEIDASGIADTITVVLKGLANIASDSTEGVYTYGPSENNLASTKITLDQVDTTGTGTFVIFDNAVQMMGDDFMADSFFLGIEWELTDPGAGSINAYGLVFWTPGFYGNVKVRVRPVSCFSSYASNLDWVESDIISISPVNELIPNITRTNLPTCPIPTTGSLSTTLESDIPVDWYIKTTSTGVATNSYIKAGTVTFTGSQYLAQDYYQIEANTGTGGLLIPWANSASGTIYLKAVPQGCSGTEPEWVRDLSIRVPDNPKMLIASNNIGTISPQICENETAPPIWNIKSKSILHDKAARSLVFKNAWLELDRHPILKAVVLERSSELTFGSFEKSRLPSAQFAFELRQPLEISYLLRFDLNNFALTDLLLPFLPCRLL